MRWTDNQLDQLRDKMSLAKRAAAWVSSNEIWIVLGLIAFWRRMTVQGGLIGPAEGMIPTIGQVKAQGAYGVLVECTRTGCRNQRKLSFDDLKLPDDVVFVEIAKHRGFRCHKCGGRTVHICANHPDPLGRRPT